jgi:hypothetical protein
LSRLFAAPSSEQYAANEETPTAVSSTDARIHDLITHPAVTWGIHTTFTSMHKKKLGRRHLPLFQRNSNNINNKSDDDGNSSHTDHLFDQFAQVVCRDSSKERSL